MLRRIDDAPEKIVPPSGDASFPSLEQPFVLEERPPGIRFYQGRTSFFHPYALLQSMSYTADLLKLVFADADVVIRGRGLHELYQRLAEHRVACIMQQGSRFVDASAMTPHISRIEGSPRVRKKQQPSSATTSASVPNLETEPDE